ncbi:MAG: cytochrome c biogenesis protein ResB [Thermoanaerobaculia bacterium]
MSLKKTFFSLKFTAIILFIILFFLLLNVLIPQERILGKIYLEEISKKNKFYDFIFNKLNFKDIPSSPFFLFSLFLFYLQLIFFIFRYIKRTIERIKIKEPEYKFWRKYKFLYLKGNFKENLEKKGFKYFKLKEGEDYFIENELSPLGFMLFHISFFLLLTGGIVLNYTRGVSIATVALGQTINLNDSQWVKKIKKPLIEKKRDVEITLNEVFCRFDDKKNLALEFRANMTVFEKDRKISRDFEINKPLKYRDLYFYPNYYENAYIIEIEDPEGYIIEKPILFSKCRRKEVVGFSLKGGFEGRFLCEGKEKILIHRGDLKGELILKEGETLFLGNYKIKFISNLPWIEIKIVEERGGGILIFGFLLGIAGILLRFIFPRREVVLKDNEIFIKSDYFPESFLNFLKNFIEVENGKN